MLCNINVSMVNAAAKKNPGKFKVDVRPAAEHRDELKSHAIESHGVVCMLGDKTLWKHPDHNLSDRQMAEGVKTVLKALE